MNHILRFSLVVLGVSVVPLRYAGSMGRVGGKLSEKDLGVFHSYYA